jgi:hypothetical protein
LIRSIRDARATSWRVPARTPPAVTGRMLCGSEQYRCAGADGPPVLPASLCRVPVAGRSLGIVDPQGPRRYETRLAAGTTPKAARGGRLGGGPGHRRRRTAGARNGCEQDPWFKNPSGLGFCPTGHGHITSNGGNSLLTGSVAGGDFYGMSTVPTLAPRRREIFLFFFFFIFYFFATFYCFNLFLFFFILFLPFPSSRCCSGRIVARTLPCVVPCSRSVGESAVGRAGDFGTGTPLLRGGERAWCAVSRTKWTYSPRCRGLVCSGVDLVCWT